LDEAKGAGYPPEAVVLVEGRGTLVDRVNNNEPRGDGLGGGNHSSECFGKQRPAEILAVERSVERQACQQDGGDLSWSPASKRVRQRLALKQVRCQRVVGNDHAVTAMPDERPGRPAPRRIERVLDEPPVKLGPAAPEVAELVILAQLLGDEAQAFD
jgi:hypothetical protein